MNISPNTDYIAQNQDGITITIRVVPRASRTQIGEILEGAIKIRLQAPPVEGKANKALIKFLAKQLKLPQRNITISAGDKSRNKVVTATGITKEDALQRLNSH